MSQVANAKYEIFFRTLAQTGNVSEAARASRVDRAGAHHKRASDKEFAARWDDAIAEYTDGIEREAYRRAVEGVEKPVIHQGRLAYVFQLNPDGTVRKDADGIPVVEMDESGKPKVLTIREYSDSLLQTMLKGNIPSKYRDNATIKIGNEGDAFKVESSPTAAARKIAFALALGLRSKEAEENATSVDPVPLAGHSEGADLV